MDNLTAYLPAPVRKAVYSTLVTINVVVTALAAAGYAPVSDRVMLAFVGVCSALGFTLSASKTSDAQ